MFPCHDDIVVAVPDHHRYPTLDELDAATSKIAASRPEVDVWQAGASRAGHPLRCVEIPGGPLHAVLVGAPHPEEPVGTLLLEHLLPLLADGLADELGFGFSVIKVGDPDGLRLNEAWFARPADLAGHLLRVYRPRPSDQFEWTFPVEYGRYAFTRPLPEARAVMEVVHRRPVDLFMGLHNTGAAGAYFYLSADDAVLCGQLVAILAAAGLPPHRGEPEMPYLESLADGVYRAFSLADDYEYFREYGSDPAVVLECGDASDAYAETVWGCFTLVAEVPQFTSPRIADTAPAGMTRREARMRGIEMEQGLARWLHGLYMRAAPHLSVETPWQRTVYAYLNTVAGDLRAERRQAEVERRFSAEATAAQLFDAVCLRELNALARVGQFANMVAAEPQQSEALRELRAEAEGRVRERAPRLAAAGGIEAVPLRTLVQVQLAALLCSLDAVRERFRPAHPRPGQPRRELR